MLEISEAEFAKPLGESIIIAKIRKLAENSPIFFNNIVNFCFSITFMIKTKNIDEKDRAGSKTQPCQNNEYSPVTKPKERDQKI